jgi:hypothetical protein
LDKAGLVLLEGGKPLLDEIRRPCRPKLAEETRDSLPFFIAELQERITNLRLLKNGRELLSADGDPALVPGYGHGLLMPEVPPLSIRLRGRYQRIRLR